MYVCTYVCMYVCMYVLFICLFIYIACTSTDLTLIPQAFSQEQQALIKELMDEVHQRQLQTYATSAELATQAEDFSVPLRDIETRSHAHEKRVVSSTIVHLAICGQLLFVETFVSWLNPSQKTEILPWLSPTFPHDR